MTGEPITEGFVELVAGFVDSIVSQLDVLLERAASQEQASVIFDELYLALKTYRARHCGESDACASSVCGDELDVPEARASAARGSATVARANLGKAKIDQVLNSQDRRSRHDGGSNSDSAALSGGATGRRNKSKRSAEATPGADANVVTERPRRGKQELAEAQMTVPRHASRIAIGPFSRVPHIERRLYESLSSGPEQSSPRAHNAEIGACVAELEKLPWEEYDPASPLGSRLAICIWEVLQLGGLPGQRSPELERRISVLHDRLRSGSLEETVHGLGVRIRQQLKKSPGEVDVREIDDALCSLERCKTIDPEVVDASRIQVCVDDVFDATDIQRGVGFDFRDRMGRLRDSWAAAPSSARSSGDEDEMLSPGEGILTSNKVDTGARGPKRELRMATKGTLKRRRLNSTTASGPAEPAAGGLWARHKTMIERVQGLVSQMKLNIGIKTDGQYFTNWMIRSTEALLHTDIDVRKNNRRATRRLTDDEIIGFVKTFFIDMVGNVPDRVKDLPRDIEKNNMLAALRENWIAPDTPEDIKYISMYISTLESRATPEYGTFEHVQRAYTVYDLGVRYNRVTAQAASHKRTRQGGVRPGVKSGEEVKMWMDRTRKRGQGLKTIAKDEIARSMGIDDRTMAKYVNQSSCCITFVRKLGLGALLLRPDEYNNRFKGFLSGLDSILDAVLPLDESHALPAICEKLYERYIQHFLAGRGIEIDASFTDGVEKSETESRQDQLALLDHMHVRSSDHAALAGSGHI